MATNSVSKKAVNGVINAIINEELTPLKITKVLNKWSKKDATKETDPEKAKNIETTCKVFANCGIESGSLTFDAFGDYSYNLVEFAPLSVASRERLSVEAFESPCKDYPFGVERPSVASSLREGSPLLFSVRDGVICESSKLVVVRPDGSYYDYIPELDAFAVEEGCRLVTVGVSPLPLSPFAYLELLRVIGNKKAKENAKKATLLRKNERVINRAKKLYDKRIKSFGSVEISEEYKSVIYNACVAEIRAKVG